LRPARADARPSPGRRPGRVRVDQLHPVLRPAGNPGHVGTAAPDGHGSPRRSGLLTRRHTLSGGKIAGLSPWVKTDWNGVALAPIAQETGMATVRTRPAPARPFPVERPLKGKHLVPMLRTTDHKQIGVLYLITTL